MRCGDGPQLLLSLPCGGGVAPVAYGVAWTGRQVIRPPKAWAWAGMGGNPPPHLAQTSRSFSAKHSR
jgi:hypothetical protein